MPYATNKEVKIYYETHGKGYPLIFVHGHCGGVDHWEKQIEGLSGRYKVIALDRRGFWRSDTPGDGQYSLKDQVEDLHSVVLKAGVDKAVFIGSSMGVPIIIKYYIDHPDKVSGLVSIGGITAAEDITLPLEVPLDMVRTPEGRCDLIKMTFAEMSIQKKFDDLLKMQWVAQQSSFDGLAANIKQLWEGGLDVDMYLPQVKVPTFIIVGAMDLPAPPVISKIIYDNLSQARLDILDNTGHLSMVEWPEKCNELIEKLVQENIIKSKPLNKAINFIFRK